MPIQRPIAGGGHVILTELALIVAFSASDVRESSLRVHHAQSRPLCHTLCSLRRYHPQSLEPRSTRAHCDPWDPQRPV